MNVPLGVLRPPAFDGSLLHGARHAGRERSVAAAPRSGARPVRWRVGTRRAAPVELAHHPQQSPQQPAQRTATADGAREEVCGGAVVVLVLCKLSQHLVTLLAWNVLTRRRRAVGAVDRRQQMSRADGSEAVRRVGDRLPAQRGSQGRGRRIGASCDIRVDERPHRRWQQVLDRGQRAVAFHGEVSPGQCRAPRQPAHDVGIQASGREERRLHGDRLDLLTRADAGVDEDHPPVGPRRLTGLARRHLQGAAGDRRGQQAEPPQAVAVCLFSPQGSPCWSVAADQISVPLPSGLRWPQVKRRLALCRLRAAVGDPAQHGVTSMNERRTLPRGSNDALRHPQDIDHAP